MGQLRDQCADRQARRGLKEAGRGTRHVVSTEHPLSTRAAVATLRSGGTAADALVAAATLQTVIMPGTVTLAGTMGGLYFDPQGGRIHAFNAGFDVPEAETGDYDHRRHLTTGRSVLVPGMLAGLYELHQRFGRLAWSGLLRSAIHFALEGFEVGLGYAGLLEHRRGDVLRRPAGRAIFAQDGSLPRVGPVLRQPQLGSTLKAIALDGPDHLYRGAWAFEAVEAVVAAGGRLSLEDLARYRLRWPDPIRGTFLETEFVTVPPPHWGGR
jgi:gamma-glutamyltranspeptidase / glutathione hydrolase